LKKFLFQIFNYINTQSLINKEQLPKIQRKVEIRLFEIQNQISYFHKFLN